MPIKFPILLHGSVMQGNQIGRKIDMPTANIIPTEDVSTLEKGVYYSRVLTGGKYYKGITNVGVKPTVNNDGEVNVETFLYDYEGNLYGEEITVVLLEFRRPERKFDSVKELGEEMHRDLEAGKNYRGIYEGENQN